MTSLSLPARVACGTVAALLLLTAYVGVWSTHGRAAYTQSVALPFLQSVPPATTSLQVREGTSRHSVAVEAADENAVRHQAPAGIEFLLPGLFLIAFFPHKLYWLGLFAGHLALSGVALAVLALGIAVHPVFFEGVTFIDQYLVDVFSLGVAVLGTLHATRPSGIFHDAPREDRDEP